MAPPANDNFANAITLSTTLPGSRTGDTCVDATGEAGEPIPMSWAGADTVQSVWYKFTPAHNGRYYFHVTNAVNGWTDTRYWAAFVVYSGSAVNALTEIRPWNFAGTSTTTATDWGSIVVDLVAGTTYYIQVSGSYDSTFPESPNVHTINFDLSWGEIASASAPANDNFANAVDLGTDPPNGSTAGTTVGATMESWEISGGQYSPSVWYKFTAATTGNREIHIVRDGSNTFYRPYANILELIGSPPPTSFSSFNFVGTWNPGFVGTHTYDDIRDTTVFFTAGHTYYIQVQDYDGSGEVSPFTLWFGVPTGPPAAPGNDNWAAVYAHSGYEYNLRRDLYDDGFACTPYAGQRDGTTVSATAEGGEASRAGFAATRSVWYFWLNPDNALYDIWVESSVDCVLGIYDLTVGGALNGLLVSDDDSGAGNWPQLTINPSTLGSGNGFAIVVDSKTAGTFTLKYKKQFSGTPPANDDFASATVISSVPYSASGTTVDATVETAEHNARQLGVGPRDTVWYKYVATFNGQISIRATCNSSYDDAYVYVDTWRGTTLAGLVRDPNPPPTGTRGFFNHFDTPAQLKAATLTVDVVSGQTYYIRVQTESGGSEDFTVYVESEVIYVDIQPSGSDEMHGTLIDSATVLVDIQVSAIELYSVTSDAATVLIDIRASSTNELKAHDYTDVGTVYYNISIDSHDCQTTWDPTQLTAYGRRRYETHTNGRWNGTRGFRRWEAIGGDGLEEC